MATEGNFPGSGRGPDARTRRSQQAAGACLTALVGVVYMSPAYAYLDPGTGSIILQGLLASIAATMTIAGMYWQRIKSFLSSIFSPKKSTDPNLKQDCKK